MKKILLITSVLAFSSAFNLAQANELIFYKGNAEFQKATGKSITTFHESPYIKKHMANLPDINKRLKGLNPFIEKPRDQIGIYGGQANVLSDVAYSGRDTTGFMPMELVLGLRADDSTLIPTIAESYKLSNNNKTITITLRKGIKWSDGVPLTANELYGWYKDVVLGLHKINDLGSYKMKVINNRTFSITKEKSNVFLPNSFSDWAGFQILRPYHYIKQYMTKYNPKAKAIALKAGYKDPKMYLQQKIDALNTVPSTLKIDVNTPTLQAYVLTKKTTTGAVFTRNPYYYRFDTKGNQLPYIDKMIVKIVGSKAVLAAKIMSGQADYSVQNNSTEQISIFKENEKKGHYKTYIWHLAYAGHPLLAFNVAYNGPDKVGHKIISDVRFRRAFSIMMDRVKINDTLFFSKGLPTQTTIHTSSKFYNEKYAKAYATYDLKKANSLLDSMGLKWDKKHQYRLRSDGKKLEFLMPFNVWSENSAPVFEMLQGFALKAGIKLRIKEYDISTFMANLRNGNKYLLNTGDGASVTDPVVWGNPEMFVPTKPTSTNGKWGTNYAKWYYNQHNKKQVTGAVEPPQDVKLIYKSYDRLIETSDINKQRKLVDTILSINSKNVYNIGIITNPPIPCTARDNVVNMDPTANFTGDNKGASNHGPETLFFKRPLYKNQIIK